MNQFFISVVVLLFVAGCAHRTDTKSHDPAAKQVHLDSRLALFSANQLGSSLPQGWEPLIILRTKKQTQYELVNKESKTVLHARAEGASSGLMHKVSIDPLKQPWLHWQWKIAGLVKSADNAQRATEDSPVRIILGFDGDKDTLPFVDQILFETARVVTGYDFPYATLMYIWENNAPIGTVIRSGHSSRIKMMVAAHGADGIGEWRDFARNVVEDYEKAFGEKPGRLIGVGVLTDTDNTGEVVEAWYGDIRLLHESVEHNGVELPGQAPLSLSQGQSRLPQCCKWLSVGK